MYVATYVICSHCMLSINGIVINAATYIVTVFTTTAMIAKTILFIMIMDKYLDNPIYLDYYTALYQIHCNPEPHTPPGQYNTTVIITFTTILLITTEYVWLDNNRISGKAPTLSYHNNYL